MKLAPIVLGATAIGLVAAVALGRKREPPKAKESTKESVAEPTPQWRPEDSELAFSPEIYVAPDCSQLVQGAQWATQTKTPRVIEAVELIMEGDSISADMILDSLLTDTAPSCLDVGYGMWGSQMRSWYDHWVTSIHDDLEIYLANPELLEG